MDNDISHSPAMEPHPSQNKEGATSTSREKKKRFQGLFRRFHLPQEAELATSIHTLSPLERIFFGALIIIFIGSTLALLSSVNRFLVREVPAHGGVLAEGVIGSPRFVNPLLGSSDADRDLTSLVYSGLLKATPLGKLIPDLAERYSISPDGLVYDFVIREDAKFHDGTPVTAADVAFTILKAQDPALKSPKRANFEGVTVEVKGDRELSFVLKQPYAPFLENATLGILPAHIWRDADAEQFPFSPYNIEPIGAGPYKIVQIKRNSSGIPTSYELKAFKDYALGEPFLGTLVIRFYQSEEELERGFRGGEIESISSISPERLATIKEDKNSTVMRSPLPRIFGVFFNQSQATVLLHNEVREALSVAADKRRIIEEVLSGYATEITGPIPPGLLPLSESAAPPEEDRVALARGILEAAGWTAHEESGVFEKKKKNKETEILRFSLSTSNTPELKAVAQILKENWEAIGAQVEIKIFEVGDLNQNVIRPRRYDALLFGEIIGRELDLFAFWHSSQRNDPGLNIALYANITADKLLETARTTSQGKTRTEDLKAFEEEVKADIPAVFLYSPDFVYVVPKRVGGISIGIVTTPGERFLNVHEWFVETENVWNFFASNN